MGRWFYSLSAPQPQLSDNSTTSVRCLAQENVAELLQLPCLPLSWSVLISAFTLKPSNLARPLYTANEQVIGSTTLS
ncbi:hypothetical protein AgCh_025584 [Apium graveolens]